MGAKLLPVLLLIATLPKSWVHNLQRNSRSQEGLTIASKIVEGNSNVIAGKRSTEQDVATVVSINSI